MIVPQKIKKVANAAYKAPEKIMVNVTSHAVDAKKFVASIGKKTATAESVSSSKAVTIAHPKAEASLLANTLLWAHLIPPMPLIASTVYTHYINGPPAKSWSLTTHITIAVIRSFLERSTKITVEEIQRISTTKKLPIPSNIKRTKFSIPKDYRKKAGDKLVPLFTKKDSERIGWDWEKDRETAGELKGEWLQLKTEMDDSCKESTLLYLHGGAYYLGCYGVYRQFLSRMIKYSKGRTCSIDYRLAPQHPFPAAVEDALATYLYLIDPPKNEGLHPIDPKKIVIAGDSAGGGLTIAVLLAIRDAGLPEPAGAMTLSPWMDLTHSLPSILSNILTDYLPPTGFKHKPSPALDYAQLPSRPEDKAALDRAKDEAEDVTDKNGKLKLPKDDAETRRSSIGPFGECVPMPSINGDDLYRVQFYADNNALKIPMVSPIFDRKCLRGLPRLLVQCGTAERLRDEAIYLSLQGSKSFPRSDKETDDEKNGKPTNITLETYTDQPHVFQLLFSNKSTSRAIKNLAAFFSDVTHSPVTPRNEKERKNKQEYITENILSIRNISPQGKTTDIKQDLLDDFTSEKWKEWENRLARPSIKARMDDVNAAYDNIIEEEFENNHAIL